MCYFGHRVELVHVLLDLIVEIRHRITEDDLVCMALADLACSAVNEMGMINTDLGQDSRADTYLT